MKRLAGLSTLALIISGTSGCGWLWGDDGYFRDRGSDYLQAQQVPPMQVPGDVELRPIEPLLPIPQQVADSRATGEYEVPRPQRLVAAEEVSEYSLQTSEDARWLVAMRAPSQVWASARQFFTDNGFQIAQERPQTGEFVTAWQTRDQLAPALVRNLGLGEGETRVRVRVEPGVQHDTSEIFLVSVQRPAGSSADVAWPDAPVNAERDRVLLDELQAGLNSSTVEGGGSASLLAEREYDAPSRVTLSEAGSGEPVLQLDTDFNRGWSSIGRALAASDILVEDLDRSLGVYYINLSEGAANPDEKPGFFSRIFGGAPDREEIEARAERYQVRITDVGGKVQVTLDKDLDTVAPADVSRRVLSMLKDSLD
ncbi:outer membrane protein assembly factor BamC [Stutzerimonas xanthomarina]|uniref:outer membrane protein assembly factor BamC n=1 Tax=Stutzerimonas xanthomarina TaxID=271420 RepID=UPI0029A34FE6|nr:outer membrane protein assembly factor BamC [Stutzerimonas xanthomarina]MDX2352763.1 outer membrane protein assembly factor BamC [Stutzerimonas xanthomarina]